ncbi:hypothetical protein GCM10028817_20100 [Spirosoma pomorum]
MIVTEQTVGHWRGQANTGYVRTAWLLRAIDVLAVLSPAMLPVAGQPHTVHRTGLLVEPHAIVTRLQFPVRTGLFEESSDQSADGTSYQPALTVTLPGPTAELDAWLHDHRQQRWVVFWLDGNGQGWLAGEPDNGLRLTLSRYQTDSNKLTLAFRGRSTHSVYRLETTSLAELFPDADFDFSFDSSFSS